MAYKRNTIDFPAEASADLSGVQYYCVKMSGDNAVNITDTAGEDCAGILQNKPESGQFADVAVLGVSKVRVGGACSYGDLLSTADSGWATVAASGTKTFGYVIDGCASGMIATTALNCCNAINALA